MASARYQPGLTDLPIELVRKVTQYDPTTIAPLSGTSRMLKRRTEDTYLNELCQQNIGVSEIMRYLESNPVKWAFGKARKSGDFHLTFYYFVMELSRDGSYYTSNDFYVYTYGIKTYTIGDRCKSGGPFISSGGLAEWFQQFVSSSDTFTDDKDMWTFPQVDLLSTYNILSARLGCYYRHKGLGRNVHSYAKARTLEILDSYYDDYKRASKTINFVGILRTLQMHQYTMANAYIFGIISDPCRSDEKIVIEFDPSGSKEKMSFQEENIRYVLERLHDKIERIVPKLHNAIESIQEKYNNDEPSKLTGSSQWQWSWRDIMDLA